MHMFEIVWIDSSGLTKVTKVESHSVANIIIDANAQGVSNYNGIVSITRIVDQPTEVCRCCGSSEVHTRTYGTPTFACIEYYRLVIKSMEANKEPQYPRNDECPKCGLVHGFIQEDSWPSKRTCSSCKNIWWGY